MCTMTLTPTTTLLSYHPNPTTLSSSSTPLTRSRFLSKTPRFPSLSRSPTPRNAAFCRALKDQKWVPALLGVAGVTTALTLVGPASAIVELSEPSNALSLPTWAVHVSSVAEWVLAMALVWQYGNKPGNEAWKGLSWGMVPLLGGAMCACTWHFFYNDQSLEVLVALQAALTVFGNATMCIAAYRIYSSQTRSENL